MEQEKYQQQYKEQQRQSTSNTENHGNYCSKCGALNEEGALFCEECGEGLNASTCPKCGADLLPGADLCEKCGTYLNSESCGFCGESLSETDAFCPECGSPTAGIKCPNCGTHNHSSFCTHCFTPLNDIARFELEKARSEPAYQQMLKVSDEINELQQLINELNTSESQDQPIFTEPTLPTPNVPVKTAKQIEREKKNEEFMRMYESMMQNSKIDTNTTSSTSIPQIIPEVVTTITSPVTSGAPETSGIKRRKETKTELELLLKQKKQEAQKILDNMCPVDTLNPQMIRNYYMARKPPVSEAVWKCIYSHYYHPNPSHCAKPFLGGKWVVVFEKIDWEYGIEQ